MRWRAHVGWGAAAALLGCGPSVSTADVYPRNCGLEGPVDLFEAEAPAYLLARRAGEHYLLEHSADGIAIETWAIDRCGESKVLLQSAGPDPRPARPRGSACCRAATAPTE